MQVADYRVGPVEIQRASDEDLRPLAGLAQALAVETVPEDPPTPLDVFIGRLRAVPETMRRYTWSARTVAGETAGYAVMFRPLQGERLNARNSFVGVLPEHRRRGLGRALFAELVRAADGDDVLFGFFTTDRVPGGEAFMRRLGAEPGLVTTTNQLDLSRIDRKLVDEWRALEPRGYRLEWIDDDVPERLMGNVVAGFQALETTPQGSLRIWDFHATPETVRAWERANREAGRHRLMLLAIDEREETAGITQISFHPSEPHLIHQNATAVVAAHQGKGIAKWMKGVMTTRVLSERTEARYMRTMNATINPPILHINTRLGFLPVWTNTIWQLPIADARRYLGERGPS